MHTFHQLWIAFSPGIHTKRETIYQKLDLQSSRWILKTSVWQIRWLTVFILSCNYILWHQILFFNSYNIHVPLLATILVFCLLLEAFLFVIVKCVWLCLSILGYEGHQFCRIVAGDHHTPPAIWTLKTTKTCFIVYIYINIDWSDYRRLF